MAEPGAPETGTLSHIDISVGDPKRSIPFYDVFFKALDYCRVSYDHADWQGEEPRRATWQLPKERGSFAVEVRPAASDKRARRYDRYEPGPHHIAFHASERSRVDRVHRAMCDAGAEILDAPEDYGDRPGYSAGYYAVFIADPDGFKLEVAHIPRRLP